MPLVGTTTTTAKPTSAASLYGAAPTAGTTSPTQTAAPAPAQTTLARTAVKPKPAVPAPLPPAPAPAPPAPAPVKPAPAPAPVAAPAAAPPAPTAVSYAQAPVAAPTQSPLQAAIATLRAQKAASAAPVSASPAVAAPALPGLAAPQATTPAPAPAPAPIQQQAPTPPPMPPPAPAPVLTEATPPPATGDGTGMMYGQSLNVTGDSRTPPPADPAVTWRPPSPPPAAAPPPPTPEYGSYGDVAGQQYAAPGAGGVTQYGLISALTGPQPQGPASYPIEQPGGGAAAGYINAPGQIAPDARDQAVADIRDLGPPRGVPVDSGAAMPTSAGQIAGLPSGIPRLNPGSPAPDGLKTAMGMRQGMVAPNGQAALDSVAAQEAKTGWDTNGDGRGQQANWFEQHVANTSPNNLASTVGNMAGNAAGGAGAAAGQALGEGFSAFKNAWDQSNPNSAGSFRDYLGPTPQYQGNSLLGSVGQSYATAMDPAAWEQMARNREAAANEENIASLNMSERRLADRAARTGLANTGGVTGNLYNQFAQRGIQSKRDIFNDTLGNQMNAINAAGGYALGQGAQDQARWQSLMGLAQNGASQDYAAARQDNPSGGAVLQDLLQALGGVAGGAASAPGDLAGKAASLLPLLMMAGAPVGV